MRIPFNKPYTTGKETVYIQDAVTNGQISGNGLYTKKCHSFFQDNYSFKKCLLTTSCTDALEMAALLLNIRPGDEVIVPSFTFVSSALAFARQGAIIKFVDSKTNNPSMDESLIEQLITPATKAIVVVHYSGVACDMNYIMQLANRYNICVVEDAAQAIDSYYNNHPLGGIGNLGCISFHETKNIQCGEGGMLIINDEKFIDRAEILWEKGTNRSKFFKGAVDKYSWVDTGSSFLPADILAAFLFAQLEHLDQIQHQRLFSWQQYFQMLLPLQDSGYLKLPSIPSFATNNAHMFYVVCHSQQQRESIIKNLSAKNILAVFHYQSLHASSYIKKQNPSCHLPNADFYSDHLLRLPMYFELTKQNIYEICSIVSDTVKCL